MPSGSIWGKSSAIWLNLWWVKCHLTQSEVGQVSSDSIWGDSSVIWLNLRWLKCHLRWVKCHLTQSELTPVSSDSIWGESSVIWLNLRWFKWHLAQSVVSQVPSGSIWGESSVIWGESSVICSESSVIWLNLRWVNCHLAQSEVSQVPSGSICGESSVIWLNLRWVNAHTKPLYYASNVLNIHYTYLLEVAKFMHDFTRRKLPTPLLNFFSSNLTVHKHNTRQVLDPHFSIIYNSIAEKSIIHRGPRIWSNIPQPIKECETKNSFNKLLKRHFLTNQEHLS